MKSFLSNPILILLIRVFLGGLFIVSSLDKIANSDAFVLSILNYKIIDTALAVLTATILPWLEFMCGLGLILGVYSRTSAFILTGLLIGFTLLVASALFRGLDISCGCFTQDPSADKIGFQKIIENCGMILMGLYLLFAHGEGIRLLEFLHKKSDHPSNT
jgi:uncharacterized membrane protein YphA (DoxX/SURF4 family)